MSGLLAESSDDEIVVHASKRLKTGEHSMEADESVKSTTNEPDSGKDPDGSSTTSSSQDPNEGARPSPKSKKGK